MKAPFKLLQIGLVILVLSLGFVLRAGAVSTDSFGDDFDDEEPMLQVATSVNRHDYPGVRDEKGLEVQASLPIPTRSPEGTSQVRHPSEDDDDAHD